MYYDLQEIEIMDGCKPFVRFEDGKQGVVDLTAIVNQGGVFEPLKDRTLFKQASINTDWAVLCWPGDIDISPETLYALTDDKKQRLNKTVSDTKLK